MTSENERKDMNLEEIKEAVDSGKTVYWKQPNYIVKKDEGKTLCPDTMQHIPYVNYNIVCLENGYTIGLTWNDETTLNEKEEDFHVQRQDDN